MSYWETGPWGLRKYTMLRKYLEACEKFSNKYSNFVYGETHGGSGRIKLKPSGQLGDGSPLIASRITPSFPCYLTEIDPNRFLTLKASVSSLNHVHAIQGDCNFYIDWVLGQIASWKFTFFFIDPDGLTYTKGQKYDQLRWQTVDKIANHPKTEVLLNFPLEAISRCGGYALNNPTNSVSRSFEDDIAHFFGDSSWKGIGVDQRKLLDHYVNLRLRKFYPCIGAILIRNTQNVPQYYLVYGSKHPVGGQIMRNIMKVEWIDMRQGVYPITKITYDNEQKWLDAEFPLKYFVFETYA